MGAPVGGTGVSVGGIGGFVGGTGDGVNVGEGGIAVGVAVAVGGLGGHVIVCGGSLLITVDVRLLVKGTVGVAVAGVFEPLTTGGLNLMPVSPKTARDGMAIL